MKKSIIYYVVIILSFVLIGYGLICLTNSNKSKFLRAIKEYYSDKLDLSDKKTDKIVKVSMNNIVKLDNSELNVNGDIYLSEDDIYINFLTDILDNSNTKLELYTNYKDLYLKLGNLSEELYKIAGNNNSNSEKNIKVIKNIVKNSIIDNLSEKSFSKAKKTISLNDDLQLNTTEYTLKVRYVDVYNILLDLEKGLKTNKATKSYFNDVSIKVEEYKKLLDSEKEMFTYSIYINKDKELFKQVIDFGMANFTIIDYENVFDAELSVSGSTISTFNITENDKKKTFNIIINGSSIELISKEIKENKEYNVTTIINGKEILISDFTIMDVKEMPELDTSKAIEMPDDIKNYFSNIFKKIDIK